MEIIKCTEAMQKKFDDLMAKYKDDDSAHFTDDEVQFMGDFNVSAFGRKFPNWCEYYVEFFYAEAIYYGPNKRL